MIKKSLIIGLLVANIVVASALLLGKLTTLVSPASFLLPAYFGLIFPFVLTFNFLFIGFWILFRKWKFILVSLIPCIICINNIFNTLPVHIFKTGAPASSTARLTVMTYNIDSFGQFEFSKKNASAALLEYINKKNPDIVCMQEFYVYNNKNKEITEQNIDKLLQKFPYRHIYYSIVADPFSEGLAIFSKYPIVNKGAIYFSTGYYSSIYADIEIKSRIIRIFNNHMESNRFSTEERKHYEDLVDGFSAQQFHEVLLQFSKKMNEAYAKRSHQADTVSKAIIRSPYPVIACGDFNDVPVSYTYTMIKRGMTDTFAAVGNGYGNTFTHKLFPFRIDFIFADKAFVPLHSKVDRVKHSDHYPVISQMALE